MSDDTDSNVISLPTRGSDSGGMPDAPDGGDLFYSESPGSGSGGVVTPESPAETTMELPPVRGPISPEVALRETGMPEAPDSGDGEYEEGEYVQPRSLADRLGDWLEYRLEVSRERHAGEAPFREAEIARKAALIEARTAQETAMMEQNSKLHTAQMKAKADKAAARGKADAARSSSSGLGADKGGRSKAGGGSGSRGGGGGGSGTNGSGGTGRGFGSGNSPKGTGNGSDRSAGGRGGPSKGNESSGGPRGRQNDSGGFGKSGAGKGDSSGSGGKNGSGGSGGGKGGSKGDGGRTHDSPASSPRAERSRGRQERAAARQAARQQRRSADQAASLADRSKDRDQDRAIQQAAREERRRAKAERKAARRAKREAAKAADGRTTLGAAVAEEAQRRWDKRRAAEKGRAAKDDGKAKDSEATTKKMPKDGPETAADGTKEDSATKEPDDGKKSDEKPSDGSGDTDPQDGTGTSDASKPDDVKDPPGTDDSADSRSFKEKLKGFFAKAGEDTDPPEPEEPSTLRPEDLGVTVDRPHGPTSSPKPETAEDDIPDAVIVDDPADPFGATTSSAASLPRAPEPHTQRPGTTRPTAQEDPVASEVNRPTSGQPGMAAQHRTDITFGEYLTEIVNIAIAAALDKDRAQELAVALGKVADALRDMAADLVGDHNIATEVVDQITDLADAADRMRRLAERCATECEIASEAARIAAMSVGRVYGQDIQAMDDAGLAHASSAAHHD